MGCVQSLQEDGGDKSLGNAVFAFVPTLRVPCRSRENIAKANLTSASFLSQPMVDHLIALRTRIEVIAKGEDAKLSLHKKKSSTSSAKYHHKLQFLPPPHNDATSTMTTDLQLAIEEYIPFLLALIDQDKKQETALVFSWMDSGNHHQETTIADARYELLSLLHLLAMLALSEANFLLTPRPHMDGYPTRISDENKRASLDAFLKASGILKCALNSVMTEMSEDLICFCGMLNVPNQHKLLSEIPKCSLNSVMTQMSEDLMEKLPPNLRKDTLYALYMQGLAQGIEIQLSFAIDNAKATLAVKRRLACEQLTCWEQVKSKIPKTCDGQIWGKKHDLFIDWKLAEAKATAYYFHGLILYERADEDHMTKAAMCLQLADSLLTHSKTFCADFCATTPATRVPPLTGSMKFLSARIPKDASNMGQIHDGQRNPTKRKDKVPELPEFAIALQPEDYTLPPVNDVWDNIGGVT